ncbi:MAG: glycosyltransferase family 2 protein [Candidatus Margulisbacteria bacterium]|nr:glycosyltransferase family 2 protein [Candidatus Margulisiibacteriota bacterium]
MPEKPELSIVVPVYNEAGCLLEFYRRLSGTLNSLGLVYEIIMVDDGSGDGSLEIISRLNAAEPRVKALSFSRNFGHMIALSAGLDFAQGAAVITLDADLQHPPELIPKLVAKWRAGGQVVNTIRKESRGAGFLKNVTASFFYRLINRIAGLSLPANAADYRLLDRRAVDSLKQIRERSRFLRGLTRWIGFRQEFVEFEADRRFAGATKYSLGRMISFAVDGITSFSAFPLRLAAYLGLVTAFFSFLYIIYALYIRIFTRQAIEGWASVLTAVLFIGGVQLIFLGVIGEYLSRIYDETKQRPLYIIDKQIGL